MRSACATGSTSQRDRAVRTTDAPHRLEIRTDPANERSVKVGLGLGFELEERLRQDERRPDGSWCDSLVFSKLADP